MLMSGFGHHNTSRSLKFVPESLIIEPYKLNGDELIQLHWPSIFILPSTAIELSRCQSFDRAEVNPGIPVEYFKCNYCDHAFVTVTTLKKHKKTESFARDEVNPWKAMQYNLVQCNAICC